MSPVPVAQHAPMPHTIPLAIPTPISRAPLSPPVPHVLKSESLLSTDVLSPIESAVPVISQPALAMPPVPVFPAFPATMRCRPACAAGSQ